MEQPCLVPGCPEVLQGLRGRAVKVCRAHRTVLTVDIDGEAFRYCGSCLTLHPTDEFTASSRVCREKESSHARGFRSRILDNQRISLTERGSTFGRGFLDVQTSRDALLKAVAPFLSILCAGEDDVWASGTVAFLTAQTRAAKVALPILYSAACYGLGPSKPETWASLTTAFSLLHLLVPYVHQHHYARPLQEVRQSAAQPGLAVSAWFQFLDALEQAKYEEFVIGSVSYASSVGQMVGVFSVVLALTQPLAGASVVPRGSLVLLLALLAAVYFPVRLLALAVGHGRRCQLMDTAMLTLGEFILFLPLAYAWMTGGDRCGVPVVFLAAGGELGLIVLGLMFQAASSFTLAALFDGPISEMVAWTALASLLRVPVLLLTPWCLEVETGRALSLAIPLVSLTALPSCCLATVAVKVRHEKAQLLRYLSHLPAKHAVPLDARGLYDGGQHLLLAVKMGNITPAHLPVTLRDRLLSAVQIVPESITGVIRPGCVMLGLEVRYRNWAEQQAALKALLSHSRWSETLLSGSESVIDMKIQGSLFRVSEGRLQHRLPGVSDPSISSVEPLAGPSGRTTLTLKLASLGSNCFKVLLRCGCHYHELEILKTTVADQPSKLSTVVVRLPEAVTDSMAWLEVMLDTGNGGLVISEAFPVLFTSSQGVAEELNRVFPTHWQETNPAPAGLLADVSRCLHEGAATPPQLLLFVAKLGLTECFRQLAMSRAALGSAEQEGQGLLGTAVISGSVDMVDLVISTLGKYRLPINPCRRAPDARGYTALHWAADAPDLDLVYKLLAEVPHPLKAWKGCASRGSGKTPAELLAEAGPEFAVNEAILEGRFMLPGDVGASHPGSPEGDRCPSVAPQAADPTAAVWGSEVAACFNKHRAATQLSLLALYGAMLAQLGWQDPLTWWTVALTCFTVHFLVPCLYCEVYLKGLAEVRGLASEQGLAVSWAFRFLDNPVKQRMYEDFATQCAGAQIVRSSVSMSAAVSAFSAPTGRLFQHWGLWWCAPALAGCGILVPLMVYSILSGRLGMWRWVEPAMSLYIRTVVNVPRMYGMATGNASHCVVPAVLLSTADNALLLGLVPFLSTVSAAAAFAIIPQPPGRLFHLPTEVLFSLLLFAGICSTEWCITSLTGLDNLGNLGNAMIVMYCPIWRLLVLCFRLKGEKQNLCSFLTLTRMRSAGEVKASKELQ